MIFEEKVIKLLHAFYNFNNIIFFIDEAHSLSATSSQYGIGFMDIIKPYLVSDKLLRLVLATTTKEVAILESDIAFMRRFRKIVVNAMNKQTKEMAILKYFQKLLKLHKIEKLDNDICEKILKYDINNDIDSIIANIDYRITEHKLKKVE